MLGSVAQAVALATLRVGDAARELVTGHQQELVNVVGQMPLDLVLLGVRLRYQASSFDVCEELELDLLGLVGLGLDRTDGFHVALR